VKIQSSAAAVGLALVLAGPAFAAAKANLTATNNTIAGPGTATVAVAGSGRIFSHPSASSVCVTVANTGKVPVGISITGADSATTSVAAGGTKALCSDDTTAIDLTCGEENTDCAAQWRVDDN
jgi:hypothetical protein